jgi:DoxX-like family
MGLSTLLPPLWLIHIAVAAVWLYEGLWCKLLNGEPHQVRVVEAVPGFGPRLGKSILQLLGIAEVALAVWVLTGISPIVCAVAQTALLVILNTCGILWARHLIPDPVGMLLKNFAFLVLAWVSASFPGWT